MRRKWLFVMLIIVLAAGAGGIWWYERRTPTPTELVLYGNVDLREVQLAFNNSERIVAVLVQEGDRLRPGQLMARLDTSRLEPQVAQSAAVVAGQRAVVERLRNGSRPEEIAQARANVDSAKADAVNARLQYDRTKKLTATGVAGLQELEVDKANLDMADAKLAVNKQSLDLAVIGPRKEDIDQAEAQLHGNEAQLALLRQELADAKLLAPSAAVVRTRLLEPGEMASPTKPVFTLAIIDPKWVRAYVSEKDLGRVRPGMTATVAVDSFPGRRFDGWIGFVSPVAEFTPKPVQTEDLRPTLVYEVRAFVKDPSDELRLGMPATVYIALDQPIPEPSATPPPSPQTSKQSSP